MSSTTMSRLIALGDKMAASVSGLTPRSRSLAAAITLIALAAAVLLAAGQEEVGFGLAAIVVLTVALRWPWVPLLVTFALAGAFGVRGGHWKAPVANLPLFELLLVAGAFGAAVWLARAWPARSREGTIVALIWVPAAAYALALLAFLNQRDLVSGAREAIILGYPLLVAMSLATLAPERLRSFVERRGWQFLGVVAAVAVLTGSINLAIGNTVPTSSGQLRSLPGEFAAPLAAGVLAAAWLAIYRRRLRVAIALAAVAGTGLLMINSRSAYLGVLVALVVLAACSPLPAMIRAHRGRAARVTLAAATAIAVALALTPLGQDGVARFGALFNTSDDNYAFRETALKRAVTKENAGEVIFGKGVGLQPTDLTDEYIADLTEGTLTVRRLEPHNSFATIYQRAGAIGLLLTLIPIGYLIRAMIRARRQPAVAWMLSLTAFMLIMILFNVVLENSFFGIWFWLPLLLGGTIALAGEARTLSATRPHSAAAAPAHAALPPPPSQSRGVTSTVDG